MTNFQSLQLEKRGPALWISLNRPLVKNAFSLEMAEEFSIAINEGIAQKDVAVLIISGKGDALSAGGDIKRMGETKDLKNFFLKISQAVHTAILEMRKAEKPIIASIPGYVGGIAFGMILGADIRIASSRAQFNAATIRLGLVANGGATYFLPRLVGFGKAAEILFSGDILSSDEALKAGFVNRVVTHDHLVPETQRFAEKLASNPRKALGRLKKVLNASFNSTLTAQLERERQAIAWSSTTPDFKEGLDAFLKKRRPVFNQP